jgi:hypothetical protein
MPIPLGYAVAALTFIKVTWPAPAVEARLLWGVWLGLGIVVVGAVRAALRPRHPLAGAQQLDRFHDLQGRIANAVAFTSKPRPDPLMRAAIADAERFSETLSPRRAVPLVPPPRLAVSGFLALSLFGLAQLEVQRSRIVPVNVARFTPELLDADDLELLRAMNRELAERDLDPEASAAARQFNQLITDVAERRLDRKQIFEQLERLERGLMGGAELDRESLDEGLQGLAQELRNSRMSKAVAEALEQKNLADAEAALKELAKKLRQPAQAHDKTELERLRQALKAASQSNAERSARLQAARQALESEQRRLLKKKSATAPQSAENQAALERNQRELKRLDRQQQRAKSTEGQFSELDKELAKAAEALRKELGEAAKDLESSGERLNQLAKRQLSNQDKEALKKQIEELREMLRQGKQGSEQRKQMLERFRQMARGQQQPGGSQGGPPKPGQGNQPGSGKGPPRLSLGGGQSLEIPTPGGQQARPGGGAGNQSGSSQSSEDWGHGSGPDPRGEASALTGKTKDVTAVGVDTGEGAAASEVVFGAAERGFVGSGYKKVFTDYHTVAEQTLASDQVPPGYKFYVRRYFQLIRPRE